MIDQLRSELIPTGKSSKKLDQLRFRKCSQGTLSMQMLQGQNIHQWRKERTDSAPGIADKILLGKKPVPME